MRFLCMHKVSPEDEAGTPPSQELMEGMGQLIGEAVKSGRFLEGDGLLQSSRRFRLVFGPESGGGSCEVTKGPFSGRNELPHRMLIVTGSTADAAVDWARKLGMAAGSSQIEVGPVTEGADLGPNPTFDPAAARRYMILEMATKASEAGEAPTAARRQAIRAVLDEMTKAGVLAFHEVLQPSARATRLKYREGKRTRIDGPFTESKELIGGFCLMQMHDVEEVIAWVDRFVRILGGTREVDIRLLADTA